MELMDIFDGGLLAGDGSFCPACDSVLCVSTFLINHLFIHTFLYGIISG